MEKEKGKWQTLISFDFEYYRPDTIEEAFNIFNKLADSGKKPIYYGGGTEIISLARVNQIEFKSVVDLKSIPECTTLTTQGNQIILGAALPLTQICESNVFPFLTEVAKRAADHTSRNRITFGGNVCSSLPYRETVMPLLVCDAQVIIAGSNGKRAVTINQNFNQSISLQKGEFLVQFIIDTQYAGLPYKSLKKTRQGELDYPLVSVAAIKKDKHIRFSFSGVCPFPFRSIQIENDLNDSALPIVDRINNAILHLPATMVNDIYGSGEYRQFVLSNTLNDVMLSLEGAI